MHQKSPFDIHGVIDCGVSFPVGVEFRLLFRSEANPVPGSVEADGGFVQARACGDEEEAEGESAGFSVGGGEGGAPGRFGGGEAEDEDCSSVFVCQFQIVRWCGNGRFHADRIAALLRFCPDEAAPIAQRECAGRSYTALAGTKYASFCGTYAAAHPMPGASPAPESTKTKAKKTLKSIFGK